MRDPASVAHGTPIQAATIGTQTSHMQSLQTLFRDEPDDLAGLPTDADDHHADADPVRSDRGDQHGEWKIVHLSRGVASRPMVTGTDASGRRE